MIFESWREFLSRISALNAELCFEIRPEDASLSEKGLEMHISIDEIANRGEKVLAQLVERLV